MEDDAKFQTVKVIESFISGTPGQKLGSDTSLELVDSAFTRQVEASKVTSVLSESISGGFGKLFASWNKYMGCLLEGKDVAYREGDRMIVRCILFTSATLQKVLADLSEDLPPCKLGKAAISMPKGPNEAPTIEMMGPDIDSNYFCCPMRGTNALVMISMETSPLCLALLCGLDLKRYQENISSKEPIYAAWFWNGNRAPLCRGSFNFLLGGLGKETFQFSDSQLCASARTEKLWTSIQSPPGIKCNDLKDLLELNSRRITSLRIDGKNNSPGSDERKQVPQEMNADENRDPDSDRPKKRQKEDHEDDDHLNVINNVALYGDCDAKQKEEEEEIMDEDIIDLCDDNNIETVTPHGKDSSAVGADDGKTQNECKSGNSVVEKHENGEKAADQNNWDNVEAYLKSVNLTITQNQEEIRTLRLQVQEKEKQVADMEKKWKGSVNKLAGEKRQRQDSVHKAQSEVSLLKQMNEELKRQVESLNSDKEKMQTEQVDPLQEQVKNLESGLHAMKKENEANLARIKSDLKKKSEEYQRSIQATMEETKKLHGQAEFWKGKHSILQKELADLKDEISNTVPPLIKKQEEQQIEYSKLKKAHAKLEQQHQQLTTESKQQNDLHEQKCSSMSLEISHLTKEITDKKGQIDTLGNQLHETKEELSTLEKKYSQACQYILEYKWCFYKAINGYRALEQGFQLLDQRVKPLLPEKIQFIPGNGHASVPEAANGASLEATAKIQASERVPAKETAPAKEPKQVRVKKRSPPSTAAPKETATKSAPLYVSFEQEVSKSGKHVNFYLVDDKGNSHLAAHGVDVGDNHYVYTNEPGFPELKATNRIKVIDWGKGIIDHQS